MMIVLGYAGVTAAVLVAAWICRAIFVARLESGQTTRGVASAVTLLVLLATPGVASVIAAAVMAARGVVGAALFVYLGYAVGLVCFIVLNRRYRRYDTGA